MPQFSAPGCENATLSLSLHAGTDLYLSEYKIGDQDNSRKDKSKEEFSVGDRIVDSITPENFKVLRLPKPFLVQVL
jgi:hypothetical protein